jgi:hypothetical protein
MASNSAKNSPSCTIAPWLSVRNNAKAVEFYKAAFGAVEVIASKIPVEAWSPGFP